MLGIVLCLLRSVKPLLHTLLTWVLLHNSVQKRGKKAGKGCYKVPYLSLFSSIFTSSAFPWKSNAFYAWRLRSLRHFRHPSIEETINETATLCVCFYLQKTHEPKFHLLPQHAFMFFPCVKWCFSTDGVSIVRFFRIPRRHQDHFCPTLITWIWESQSKR